MAGANVREQRVHGGASIFIACYLRYVIIAIEQLPIEMHFEACAVKLTESETPVVAQYRPCDGSVPIFFGQLELLLNFLSLFSCDIILCGDLTIEGCGRDHNTIMLHNVLSQELRTLVNDF